MNTSTYYDLNLVEGSDIVNPLTVDVPNYEKIDEVMHDNAVASISTATELLNGTVHSLVRDNDEANVFRFVATANWTTGDTVTVDGVQVTALLPSGEPLATGAYVINANVLCILTGTLLTVLVPGGKVAKAEDADKLGGELPSHYATSDAVTQASAIAQAASVLANQLSAELSSLKTYSYDERIVGTYADGKVLYEKTFHHVVNDKTTSGQRFQFTTPTLLSRPTHHVVAAEGVCIPDAGGHYVFGSAAVNNALAVTHTSFISESDTGIVASYQTSSTGINSVTFDLTLRYTKN